MSRVSGLGFGEVEVVAGCKSRAVTIDLRGAQWLTMRVVAAEKLEQDELGRFRITGARKNPDAVGPRYAWTRPGAAPLPTPTDHAWTVHPCDRELELTSAGTRLRPHPETGTVRTRRGGTFDPIAIAPPTVAFGRPRANGTFPTHVHLIPRGTALRIIPL